MNQLLVPDHSMSAIRKSAAAECSTCTKTDAGLQLNLAAHWRMIAVRA